MANPKERAKAPRTSPAKVKLRALERSDLERSLRWVNDPDVTRFTGTLFPISSAEEEAWYARIQQDSSQRVFAIEAEDGVHIGNCGFRDVQVIPRKAELWIYIGEGSRQDRGYGPAAIGELLAFGFQRMNLHRIWVRVFSYNERAVRAFEKCGFAREGLLRDDVFRDGRYHDTHILSILRTP
jgi:RimJ/RimL family protein N-acetyltransferase